MKQKRAEKRVEEVRGGMGEEGEEKEEEREGEEEIREMKIRGGEERVKKKA